MVRQRHNWLLAGCLVVGLAAAVIALLGSGLVFSGDPRVDWETLLVGFCAVTAAFLTVRQINAQTTQVSDLAQQDLKRQNFAARAVLPVALSALGDYAERCVQILVRLLPEDIKDHRATGLVMDVPTIPENLIKSLQDAIRFATPDNSKALADLLGALQIQHSRLRGIRRGAPIDVMSAEAVARRVVDAAEIYAGSSSCYRYARRSTELINIELTRDNVASAVRNCGVFDNERIDRIVAAWTIEHSTFRFRFANE